MSHRSKEGDSIGSKLSFFQSPKIINIYLENAIQLPRDNPIKEILKILN